MLRMSETPIELEPQLSIHPSTQPELERLTPPPLPPPLLELPLPTQNPSETEHHTQIESETQQQQHRRLLLLLLGLSLCAAFLGFIYFISQNLQNKSKNQISPGTHSTGMTVVTPCASQACQQASVHLSMSADPFSKPCDYFLFTCRSDAFIPKSRGKRIVKGSPGSPWDQNGKSMWLMMRGQRRERKILDRKMELLHYLREILESSDRDNGSAVQKTTTFYQSCLDTRSIETAGVDPFLTLIQKLGGWAVSGQWNKTDFNSTLSMLMRDYATFPFFNVDVGKDPKEAAHGMTKQYIEIDQPELLIPIEWNNQTQKSQARSQALRPFLQLCQTYVALLGAPPDNSIMHVGPFMSLSSELAVAATPQQYRLSKGQLYQHVSIKELQIHAPAIDWLGCLQAVFQPMSLDENELILVHNLPYIVHMSTTIEKWLNRHEFNNIDPLQTYMVLSLLKTLLPALDSRFSKTAINVSVFLDKNDWEAPRWRRCLSETERGFDPVLTHLLSERTSHREAEEIIQNIFSTFKTKLHELKWTNQTSLQSVMKKVQSLIPRLWTTSEISTEAELDLLFSTVSVSNHSFFSNYVQLLSLRQKRRRKLLSDQTKPVDILSVTPLLLGNELLFPMGMFIPPLFHPTYPRAMNYGVVGFLIAKDILHLLLPNIYSESETVHAAGECVWAHYLTVTEKASRGGVASLSAAQQQEVWVQYTALQIALQAYHQSLKTCPRDMSILGLSHTHLFLSSFAQVNCDDPGREFMPLEPSFLITVICAKSHLCPTNLQCPSKTQQPFLQIC